MAPISQPTFSPSDINIQGATEALITNLNLTVSGNEYSHSLQSSLKTIEIKSRTNGELKIAFIIGDTAFNYYTIPPRCTFTLSGISFTGKTLYIQSSANNDVAEILEIF